MTTIIAYATMYTKQTTFCNTMKKVLLFSACVIALSTPIYAQATLLADDVDAVISITISAKAETNKQVTLYQFKQREQDVLLSDTTCVDESVGMATQFVSVPPSIDEKDATALTQYTAEAPFRVWVSSPETLSIVGVLKEQHATIVSASGTGIYTTTVSDGSSIDVSGLPHGIYILHIEGRSIKFFL